MPEDRATARDPESPPEETDFAIIGSGVAGLFTAIRLAEKGRVAVLSKQDLVAGNTWFAQGGIAAAFSKEDSPQLHLQDTWEAGAFFGDREAISVLVEEAPERIRDLQALGVRFDHRDGTLDLGREGAHSRKRILHIGGDATGRELVEALLHQARLRGVVFVEEAFAADLWVEEGLCRGVHYRKGGRPRLLPAAAVILATGGCGGLFSHTSNAPAVTGDGLAMAYRAGAVLRDLEFFQFHPTVYFPPRGNPFLISEAVRGEGAYLVNRHGERFLQSLHPQGELGPRDVVARGILTEQKRTGGEVFLDLRHLGASFIPERFPTIYSRCLEWGLDITRELIPVSPAAHYLIGGIAVDLEGRTAVPNLFAVGEVASTGVHGANRLASNSLLEGLVFGHRVAEAAAQCAGGAPGRGRGLSPGAAPHSEENALLALRGPLQEMMWEEAGLMRRGSGLEKALSFLEALRPLPAPRPSSPEALEIQNMLLVSLLMVRAALERRESRGCHFREDFPEPDPALGDTHITFRAAAPWSVTTGASSGDFPGPP